MKYRIYAEKVMFPSIVAFMLVVVLFPAPENVVFAMLAWFVCFALARSSYNTEKCFVGLEYVGE